MEVEYCEVNHMRYELHGTRELEDSNAPLSSINGRQKRVIAGNKATTASETSRHTRSSEEYERVRAKRSHHTTDQSTVLYTDSLSSVTTWGHVVRQLREGKGKLRGPRNH